MVIPCKINRFDLHLLMKRHIPNFVAAHSVKIKLSAESTVAAFPNKRLNEPIYDSPELSST